MLVIAQQTEAARALRGWVQQACEVIRNCYAERPARILIASIQRALDKAVVSRRHSRSRGRGKVARAVEEKRDSLIARAAMEKMTIELYHNDLSVCAQKVRLVLAEKD